MCRNALKPEGISKDMNPQKKKNNSLRFPTSRTLEQTHRDSKDAYGLFSTTTEGGVLWNLSGGQSWKKNWKEIQKPEINSIKNNTRFYIPVICQIVRELTSWDFHVLCKITLDADSMSNVSEMPALERRVGAARCCNLHCMKREMNSKDTAMGPWEPACLTPCPVILQILFSRSTLSLRYNLICSFFLTK